MLWPGSRYGIIIAQGKIFIKCWFRNRAGGQESPLPFSRRLPRESRGNCRKCIEKRKSPPAAAGILPKVKICRKTYKRGLDKELEKAYYMRG